MSVDPAGGDKAIVARLRDRIIAHGPIGFHDWMEACLYDDQDGYYCRRDLARWGRRGDYRTSPGRSPLFGATFARKFSSMYEEMGNPAVLTIVEAGAGSGDFAYDVLQTLQCWFPAVFSATRYIIDETSKDSRDRIALKLSPFAERVEFSRISDDTQPLSNAIIFSNELLDSFPVNLVVKRKGTLQELFVSLSPEGRFVWVDGDLTPRAAGHLKEWEINLDPDETVELNIDAIEWIEQVASILRRGYVVTVDYGADQTSLSSSAAPSSLRAFHKHQLVDDVLAQPGEQDITTTIDSPQIIKAGENKGLRTISHERQDQFLLGAGLLDQLELMTRESITSADALYLRSSVRDLILPGGMSECFQVLVQDIGIAP